MYLPYNLGALLESVHELLLVKHSSIIYLVKHLPCCGFETEILCVGCNQAFTTILSLKD